MKMTMMKVMAFLVLFPAAALAKDSAAKAGVEAGNKAFMAGVDKGDAAAIAACYTADAKVLPPNGETVSGTKDIEALFAGLAKMGVKVVLETSELLDAGKDMAIETGKYNLTDGKGTALDNGKYIVVWKKDGGKWKLFRDMWNSSKPAPPAPPPAAAK
jgi:uncharacterized protein (TIGR02246 family)